jgi:glutamate-5-semialdehyde dehydrogenase
VIQKLSEVRNAARALRLASTDQKNVVLSELERSLLEKSDEIIAANQKDLFALDPARSEAFRDRLLLNRARIESMAESLRQVAQLPDPVGEEVDSQILANGLRTRRMRSPLGVVFMIFESRPNVAIEAFSLGFKAGNAMILRGGRESQESVRALSGLIRNALSKASLPEACGWCLEDPDRSLALEVLKQERYIDVVVPRGGEALIDFVVRNTRIPIIKNDRGLCHVYVHEDADLEMALKIVRNAKTQRPGVCNAMETLLVHQAIAASFLPKLYDVISGEHSAHPVEWHACSQTLTLLGPRLHLGPAHESAWDTEHLALRMNVKVVTDLKEALAHIERHGSRHSEAIVTRSEMMARQFQAEVDAAAVYWNASTRFTDGFELGLGGELGISTQKLHVRGPVGLRELTSVRWVLDGTGQVRGE